MRSDTNYHAVNVAVAESRIEPGVMDFRRRIKIGMTDFQVESNGAQGDATIHQTFSFDLAAEIRALQAEPSPVVGRSTRTLVSLPALRVLLVAMKAGARWDEHVAPGRITVQMLVGRIRLSAARRRIEMPAGHLAALGTRVPHDVEAVEESVFLLTVDRDAQ